MRVLVAGSRSITDPAIVHKAILDSGFAITTLISGMARGVDRLADAWAKANSIPVSRYYANWNEHGRAAGMIRNRAMVEQAEAAVIVWDRVSAGTRHTIGLVKQKAIPIFLLMVDPATGQVSTIQAPIS